MAIEIDLSSNWPIFERKNEPKHSRAIDTAHDMVLSNGVDTDDETDTQLSATHVCLCNLSFGVPNIIIIQFSVKLNANHFACAHWIELFWICCCLHARNSMCVRLIKSKLSDKWPLIRRYSICFDFLRRFLHIALPLSTDIYSLRLHSIEKLFWNYGMPCTNEILINYFFASNFQLLPFREWTIPLWL